MEIEQLEQIIRECWNAETCNPSQRTDWTLDKPYVGQCFPTALVIQDYCEGKLAYNRKLRHVWNILPDGSEHDLTKNQIPEGTEITQSIILERKLLFEGRFKRLASKTQLTERYELLKSLVDEKVKERYG